MIHYKTVQQDAIDAYKNINQTFANFNWFDRELYANWLAQTYFYVRHVTRALAFAASKCSSSQDGVFSALVTGIREELGHEKVALRDLEALGYNIEEFSEYIETLAYRQSFYSMIDAFGPDVMPGFALPMEAIGPKCWTPMLKDLEKAHGAHAIKFIKLHAELDVDHFDDGLLALENMSPRQLECVHKGVLLSEKYYIDIIERLILETQKEKGPSTQVTQKTALNESYL